MPEKIYESKNEGSSSSNLNGEYEKNLNELDGVTFFSWKKRVKLEEFYVSKSIHFVTLLLHSW